MRRPGHTLVELVTIVLVLSFLACIAVPRFNLGAVWRTEADALVRQIVTDLRRTRTLAVLHAAGNPTGFALVVEHGGYQITDLQDSTVLVAREIPSTVKCKGGEQFEFGPLGNLREGSDTELRISTEGRNYTIEIVPATGAVKCVRNP